MTVQDLFDVIKTFPREITIKRVRVVDMEEVEETVYHKEPNAFEGKCDVRQDKVQWIDCIDGSKVCILI